MLVRIIEIRAGDHTGELLAENVRLLLLYPNGNNPVPGDIGCLIPGIVFADGCMPRKMYIATFVVRD